MDELEALLSGCTWPSEALWRSLELRALEGLVLERPILELGCGDGHFSELLTEHVEEAIDLNARAVEIAGGRSLYGRVRCMDAALLAGEEPGRFGTVLANCVLEHVSPLPGVLRSCARLLRPGGRLVATVPLVTMNDHLLFKGSWYAELRRRQLVHRNLWGPEEWVARLVEAGFGEPEVHPYLGPALCRLWDAIDAPACLGVGRYRAGAVVRRVGSAVLPARLRRTARTLLAASLRRAIARRQGLAPACAALLVAGRPER